jgi:hypothetical protein
MCMPMNLPVTCKRDSAKYCVNEDLVFLWKHTIFGYLPNRNPSTDHYKNFSELILLVELSDVQRMARIGLLGVAPQKSEI